MTISGVCSECKKDKDNVRRWGREEWQEICKDCHKGGRIAWRRLSDAELREVEQSLFRDGIIEDPDTDGGLLG